jgi:BT4734-like, N-terminal domain
MTVTPETATAPVARGCPKRRIIVSTVRCAVETTPLDLDVCDVVKIIQTGGKKLRHQITQIRNRFEAELAIAGGDLKAAKLAVEQLKKALPGVMWCGQFSNREHPAADKLQEHSGLLCADLDELGQELPRVREQLQTSPHLWALFISPTGIGLKAVVRVPADASKHAGGFSAVAQHVRELTGVQIDESGKDISRLCFLTYDPELYHNPNATELEPLPEPEKPKSAFNSSGEVNLSERQRIATDLLGHMNGLQKRAATLSAQGSTCTPQATASGIARSNWMACLLFIASTIIAAAFWTRSTASCVQESARRNTSRLRRQELKRPRQHGKTRSLCQRTYPLCHRSIISACPKRWVRGSRTLPSECNARRTFPLLAR